MGKQNAILIFDVGKTNKKIFLFDEDYNILFEESGKFDETEDGDGFPCEDLTALTNWIRQKFHFISSTKEFHVKAVNFSAYGASLVHLDKTGKPLTSLYNYLKPYPENLKQQFYETYGGENLIARQTASPVLGSLNSGMQLYRLKYEQPDLFSRLQYSLHLPQYISFLISSELTSDVTSIGCHTQLWDFQNRQYHPWVEKEEIIAKLAPVYPADTVFYSSRNTGNVAAGIGLHDSSAALVPYLTLCKEPFILLSTGTWCISLNPFNLSILSDYELQNDCLCYLTHEGKSVKAARLFAGYEHEKQVKRISAHFNKHVDYYKTILYNDSLLKKLQQHYKPDERNGATAMMQLSSFPDQSLHNFETYEEAYHQLMLGIIKQQIFSTRLVLKETPVKQMFVDGGFGRNDVYMNLLAFAFPHLKIYAASIAQASALGAALILHQPVNQSRFASNMIELKHYPATGQLGF